MKLSQLSLAHIHLYSINAESKKKKHLATNLKRIRIRNSDHFYNRGLPSNQAPESWHCMSKKSCFYWTHSCDVYTFIPIAHTINTHYFYHITQLFIHKRTEYVDIVLVALVPLIGPEGMSIS